MISNPIRVFIVDDHPLVREWLGNLLRLEDDIEVVGEADEADAALAAMLDNTIDVAVIDLSLKRGSGLDLIKTLQTEGHPKINTLVLSMHEEIGDVKRALKAGARGYVMKRESTSQIVNAIRQVAAGKIFLTPELQARLAESTALYAPIGGSPKADVLSDRELDVFRRIGLGHSTRRIADDLGIGQKTIQTYCARIKEKLGLSDGSELLRSAVQAHEQGRE